MSNPTMSNPRDPSKPSTETGRQLYNLLPEVYRTRDQAREGVAAGSEKRRDLAAYLDGCGELLDRIRNTLDQRLADSFPEGEYVGFPKDKYPSREAQSWLLPYFARLLDVQLRSPHIEGRRAEVANAVAWRQRKGTTASVEAIAEAVGQLEAEVHEGWQRVAVTPRVDTPQLPAAAFGLAQVPDPTNPLVAAQHPALPTVTPNFGRTSRAVQTESRHPLARHTRFPTGPTYWRQANRQGLPCFPGSFEDATRRTVDLRSPSWNQGHYHPRRVLLFVPPPSGFFTFDQVELTWANRAERVDDSTTDGVRELKPRKEADDELPVVTITTPPPPLPEFGETVLKISDLNFNGTLTITAGRVELERVAAQQIVIQSADTDEPVLSAKDCLFSKVEAKDGLVRLEACTVRDQLDCARLQASDCILPDALNPDALNLGFISGPNCIRYSRVGSATLEMSPSDLQRAENETVAPIFFDFDLCDESGMVSAADWGVPGYAVLHPATPQALCTGAEDGGEMGAYHHQRHCLQAAAVLSKLEEYVPVGLEAALIPDPRLLSLPPTI